MESVARFDKKFTTYPDGPRAATLSQIQEAFEQFKLKGLGKTGEFTLAHRQGDNIVFLEAHQHVLTGETKSVPFESELAQPMRRALSGESGTILGPDYHGHMVLAAFAPVAELDLGLVAKIDLEEIRAPFLRAGWIVLGVATIVIALGTLLFFIVGEPMIRRIRESEARYRELFDHSPTPILVVDPRTTMPILFNKPLLSILEYSQAEFASTPIEDYEVLDSKSEIDTNIEEFMIAGGAEFETLWRTRSGELRDVVVHARHLEMEGKPVLHCVITDLTERVRAERKVRELQEHLMQVSRINELGEMASALAHELKQPLTAALNYINACRRCIDGEDGAAASRAIELSKKAGAQIDRAAAIINSLQALVHRRPSQRTTQDINDVVREAAMLALADAAVRGIEYRLRLAPDLPPITIDRIQIQQVVFNLVLNAIEAMSTSAVRHLSIETAQTDPATVETAVRDTGSGLPEEVADRLFQPFVTTKPRGMGMGLSISQTIITAHGGRIWAEPGREGGTTLFFDLPISS